MSETIVILGNGFDRDWGVDLSFNAYCKYPLCIAYDPQYSYKKRWSDFENEIREKILSWYDNKGIDEDAKKINEEWIAFKKNFSYFFTETTNHQLNINKLSCAYFFLKSFSDRSKVYTFNYTYPYEYLELDFKKEFIFVHGRYYYDSYKKHKMIMSQSPNMIVGIDFKRIPTSIKQNNYFTPIIKRLNNTYLETDIVKDLLKAKYVIIFGLFVGITDSDYFDDFFTAILNKISNCDTIYYVTKDKNSYMDFLNNIELLGYNKQVICSNVNIVPVYTELGTDNSLFKKVLSLI